MKIANIMAVAVVGSLITFNSLQAAPVESTAIEKSSSNPLPPMYVEYSSVFPVGSILEMKPSGPVCACENAAFAVGKSVA